MTGGRIGFGEEPRKDDIDIARFIVLPKKTSGVTAMRGVRGDELKCKLADRWMPDVCECKDGITRVWRELK